MSLRQSLKCSMSSWFTSLCVTILMASFAKLGNIRMLWSSFIFPQRDMWSSESAFLFLFVIFLSRTKANIFVATLSQSQEMPSTSLLSYSAINLAFSLSALSYSSQSSSAINAQTAVIPDYLIPPPNIFLIFLANHTSFSVPSMTLPSGHPIPLLKQKLTVLNSLA